MLDVLDIPVRDVCFYFFSFVFFFFSKKAYQNHLNPLKRVRETFRTMNTIEIGQSVGVFFGKGGGGWKSFFKKCKRERRVALFPKRKYYHL